MKRKPIAQPDAWGFINEAFLVCGKDGRVRVKDGRSLEQYINDPRLVFRRKHGGVPKPAEMVLCDAKVYNDARIPRSA